MSPVQPVESQPGMEEALRRFDQAWKGGTPPRLEDFLPVGVAENRAARLALLEELVKVDLECRWRGKSARCKPWTLEDYVKQYPELGSVDRLSVALIGVEYWVRQQWGDRPGHGEYLARFVPQGAQLQAHLRQIDQELKVEFAGEKPARRGMPRPMGKPAPTAGPIDSVAGLVSTLCGTPLLGEKQKQELCLKIKDRFAAPQALAKDLLARNWLTPYQINQLFLGKASDLVMGSYVVLERLGEGGTGQVFKARHLRMEREVVLKLIRRELLEDAEVLGRFHREIQLISQLSHPHVVQALDAGPLAGTHVLIMEYVDGIDLRQLVVQSGPLPVAQACAYVRQAALGLQHIHERGLVHRDLKPSNLLVTRKSRSHSGGLVKILDLGLARLTRNVTGEVTSLITPTGGAMLGTPDYLAPEQALDFHTADIRADIYGLGCTLFYLLTGQPPFPGGTVAQKVARHLQAPPPSVAKFRAELPAGLDAVLTRMLAKRPDDRYQTPAEVADVLAPFAGPPGTTNPEGGVKAEHAPLMRLPKFIIPRRRLLLAGLGVACLAILIWIVGLTGSSPPGRPEKTAEHLDRLDPEKIPAEKRLDRVPELVAVLGASEPNKRPLSIAFSPDHSKFLMALGSGEVRHWDLRGAEPKEQTPFKVSGSGMATFSPDGQSLAISTANGFQLELWDLSRAEPRSRAVLRDTEAVSALTFTADGRTLAAGGRGGSIRLWDLREDSPRMLAKLPAGQADVRALAFAPNGQDLASAAAANLLVWNLRPAQPTVRLKVTMPVDVRALAFAADNQTLASGSFQGTVGIWDLRSGSKPKTEITFETQIGRLAFAPDGRTFICSTGRHVYWHETHSGSRLQAWKFPPYPQHFAFAGDGRHLAIASDDCTVCILRLDR